MGQAQFLPSSYLAYAVDFDGDGYADIWRSVPDALASIANYLQKFGWRPGLPWGFEVAVPQKFDYRASRGAFPEWAQHAASASRCNADFPSSATRWTSSTAISISTCGTPCAISNRSSA
jgi:membrane-bound lytic murein transglycosylase B